MNREDRKTIKVLKRLASEVRPLDFSVRFGVQMPIKQKTVNIKVWVWPIVAVSVCLVFALGFFFGHSVIQKHPTDQSPSIENPPTIDIPLDPPTHYFINSIISKSVDYSEADAFCENVLDTSFTVYNKDEASCFLYIPQEEDNNILGVCYDFYYNSAELAYMCILSILPNSVVDADNDYKDSNFAFIAETVNAWVYVKDLGFNDGYFEYKAIFEKDEYKYLIHYLSERQDFEAGFSTIF